VTVTSIEDRRARRDAHRQAVRDAERRLHEIADELFGFAVGVAVTGELYEWDRAQPIGAFANLEEMLAGVQDGRVVALLQLREAVATAVEHLRKQL